MLLAIPARALSRTIRIIVPYAAGGAGDSVIRLLSEPMEAQLGQKLVIESNPPRWKRWRADGRACEADG